MKNYINSNHSIALAGGLALLFFSACQNSNAQTLGDNHKELSEKLDAIDGKLSTISAEIKRAKPAARGPKRPQVGQLYNVTVNDKDLIRGGKNAKVTIVEATEFACPYCAKLAELTEELLKEYSDEDLRIVSKQFIVHPGTATKPALAACAANRQGKFAEFEPALWQQAWHATGALTLTTDALSEQGLEKTAASVGIDLDQFKKDMNGDCKEAIRQSQTQMRRLGVSGTPAVYINGVYYGGPRTAEGFKQAIDREIKLADQALAKGQGLETYYASRVSKGKTSL